MSIIKIVICLVIVASFASATNITANFTVDDALNAYISTSDATLGTLVGSGPNSWFTTYTFTAALTPGVTNYLHIVASDVFGLPSMFVGDFTLSDTGFHFSNGTQFLITDTTHWGASVTGFGGAYSTPLDEGVNGTSPWGLRPGINASARLIWLDPVGGATRYFSTTITPNVAGVPEPSSVLLLGAGLVLFSIGRRKVR